MRDEISDFGMLSTGHLESLFGNTKRFHDLSTHLKSKFLHLHKPVYQAFQVVLEIHCLKRASFNFVAEVLIAQGKLGLPHEELEDLLEVTLAKLL